ncbi:hypothetical protein ILUMI_18892 [Ignelater luminosus]|uniref:Transposable element P transposase-like RNase H domain-containing protein n=1 Tax=Ignelater luminosus TaxID=2038154 RepID=A0A8K0CL81_IGNLU|nr:hypothetical protein ILUMI_18892 [Ignelater luminosus]
MKIGIDCTGIDESHKNYLAEKIKHLSDREKYVHVLLDEIYIKSHVSYKGGKIEGLDSQRLNDNLNGNGSSEIATTVQTFMLSSIFSKNKDTDDLEAGFGQYRQMSGAYYHVTLSEILESEKKLKFLSLINLTSRAMGTLVLKNFLSTTDTANSDSEENCNNCSVYNKFDDSIISNDTEVSENNLMLLIYIGGYIAYKIKQTCTDCYVAVTYDKSIELESSSNIHTYIKLLDRGGLKYAKDFLVEAIIN